MNTYRVAYLKRPTSKHATTHETLADSIAEAVDKVAARYNVPLDTIVRVVQIPEEKIREREERMKELEKSIHENHLKRTAG